MQVNASDIWPQETNAEREAARKAGIKAGTETEAARISEEVTYQLEAFVEAREDWIYKDYGTSPCSYAVYDLDGDGRLELLAQVTAGTGLFSENHFYRVKASGGIEELPQEYYAEYAQFEIDGGPGREIYKDRESSTVYFMASDRTKNGLVGELLSEGAFYVKDGLVHSMVYRGSYEPPEKGGLGERAYYDGAGNQISREKWEQLYEDFLKDKEKLSCDICFQRMETAETERMTDAELLRMLAESYGK